MGDGGRNTPATRRVRPAAAAADIATAAGTAAARAGAAVERMGEAAAHAARAAVRRPTQGHHHPALARPDRRNDLLHLSADLRAALAADAAGLCAIRRQHYRYPELLRGAGVAGGEPTSTGAEEVVWPSVLNPKFAQTVLQMLLRTASVALVQNIGELLNRHTC